MEGKEGKWIFWMVSKKFNNITGEMNIKFLKLSFFRNARARNLKFYMSIIFKMYVHRQKFLHNSKFKRV